MSTLEQLVKAYYSQKFEGSHGRYPLGVVVLTLPPGAMDVNLEPNKTKVLLNDEVCGYVCCCFKFSASVLSQVEEIKAVVLNFELF